MINLLLGSSGGGKSFEAVVFQILPALERGRKVITNLPLNIEAFSAINHEFPDLIELRTRSQPIRGRWLPTQDQAFEIHRDGTSLQPDTTSRVFSKVWDYYDTWKHPETGIGALFVIDECQYSIPRGRTDIQVEEFTALHRHYKVDILYITQSYGKISKTIIDNLQMVYRVRKQSALGRETHYIRKVQDGIRGEVMNVTSREYISAYFQLYKSHTQSTGIGSESGASDITPLWKHWSFQGAAICFIILIVMFFTMDLKNPIDQTDNIAKIKPVTINKPIQGKSISSVPKATLAVYDKPESLEINTDDFVNERTIEKETKTENHPFFGYGIHIKGSGYYRMPGSRVFFYSITISQNGQLVSQISDSDLKKVGYKTEAYSKCSLKITYGDYIQWVTCSSPSQQVEISSLQ